MRIFILIIMTIIFFCTANHSASALVISKKGNTIFLSGLVVAGDEYNFKEMIADPENANIKIIKLNSQGGRTIVAIEIGRMIRARNLTTFVDAKSDNCASACTILFSSGVHRHYINADFIKDGVYDKKVLKTGLGYHEAHSPLSL